jgi:hypothetical protein
MEQKRQNYRLRLLTSCARLNNDGDELIYEMAAFFPSETLLPTAKLEAGDV